MSAVPITVCGTCHGPVDPTPLCEITALATISGEWQAGAYVPEPASASEDVAILSRGRWFVECRHTHRNYLPHSATELLD